MTDSIFQRLELIRRAPLADLRRVEYLEHELIPALGLHEPGSDQYPPHLLPYCDAGLKIWQWPCQLAPYLVWLSRQDISSYVEIGTSWGGMWMVTTEYLRRFNPRVFSLGCDPTIREATQMYSLEANTRFYQGFSQDNFFVQLLQGRRWGLALIDGDHAYESAIGDWQLVAPVSNLVALHDVSPGWCEGVQKAWRQIKSMHPANRIEEFCDSYEGYANPKFGLGVVKVRV